MRNLPVKYSAVLEHDPVGVICIYRVVLACGHTFAYQTKTNYVPKRLKCPKCNKSVDDKFSLLDYLPFAKKKKRKK